MIVVEIIAKDGEMGAEGSIGTPFDACVWIDHCMTPFPLGKKDFMLTLVA